MFWLTVFIILISLWAIAERKLSGPDLSHFDTPAGEEFAAHDDDPEKIAQFMEVVRDVEERARATKSLKKGFAIVRDFADNLSSSLETDTEFRAVTANGVRCEWAIATGVDPRRRFLFLHGGAFLFGSPKGHRIFADQLSRMANAAVLSVDYSMMPEAKRMQCSVDAQNAYHWILSHGPDGELPLDKLFVAGDSAGGNLTLMLATWSKTGAARKPDAIVAFSPSADTTLAAPTFKSNAATDALLGKPLGFLAKMPRVISAWLGAIMMRANPANPILSPLFADLSELPPALIHASSSEVLLGDAVRFTNKAREAGSDVTLQVWRDQPHDWHLFNKHSGSGKQAWSEVEKFLQRFAD